MRKFFLNFMTVVLATSLVMVSCKKEPEVIDPDKDQTEDTQKPGNGDNTNPGGEENNPGGEETENPDNFEGNIVNVVATVAEGDAYPERAYIDVVLMSEEQALRISFNMSAGDTVIYEGEYALDIEGNYAAGTYDPNYTYWATPQTEEGQENFIVDGSAFVSVEGENFNITTKFIDMNGDSINYTYVGAIEWTVHRTPPYVNNDLTQASAQYGGDMAGSGNGLYLLYLANDDNPSTGFPTDEIVLYLFADGLGSAAELPTGTLKFPTTQEEIFGAKTLVPGVYDETQENPFLYSWALTNDGTYYTGVYQLAGGTLEIVKNADNTYTVTGNMVDAGDYAGGAAAQFSYTGPITITDVSQANAAPAKAIKSVRVNNVNKAKRMNRNALRIK